MDKYNFAGHGKKCRFCMVIAILQYNRLKMGVGKVQCLVSDLRFFQTLNVHSDNKIAYAYLDVSHLRCWKSP